MTRPVIYSIIESPSYPNLSSLYRDHGFEELKFTSQRKAIGALKKQPPDYLVAEFFYGWGNNYAGVNVSNLDTLLASLQRYAPAAKTIVLASKKEKPHIGKLEKLFPLHAVLDLPVNIADLEKALGR